MATSLATGARFVLAASPLIGGPLAGWIVAIGARRRERRERTIALLREFLDELWTPHVQAWSRYTARLVARTAASDTSASELELLRWRVS